MSTEEHKSVISLDVKKLLSPADQAIKKVKDLNAALKKLDGKGKMTDPVKGATETAKGMGKAVANIKKCADALENMKKKALGAAAKVRDLAGNMLGLKTTGDSTSMSMKSLAATLGKLVSVGAIVTAIKAAISAGQADLADAAQFGQVFGDVEAQAKKSLEAIAEESGSTAYAMRSSFSQIGAYAKVTGMSSAEALSFSERAMRAAADSAAFYDRNLSDVMENVRSFIKGNYENDAALGLASTEATRGAMAIQMYGQEFKKLSETQKGWVLLSQIEQANELSGALGQAARESGNWSTQIQLLKSRFSELTATIGTGFIRLLTPVLQTLNTILSAVVDFANAAAAVFSKVFGTVGTDLAASASSVDVSGISDSMEDALSGVSDTAKEAASSTSNVGDAAKKSTDAAKKAADEAKKSLFGFDKINKLAAESASDATNAAKKAASTTPKTGTGGIGSGAGITGGTTAADNNSIVGQAVAQFSDLQKKIEEAIKTSDFTEVGNILGQKLKDGLDSIPWDKIQTGTAKVAKSLATLLNGIIEVDGLGTSIGTTLGQALNTGFIAFNTFVGNFHWDSLGSLISSGIQGAFNAFDWGQLTAAWTNVVAAKINFVSGLIQGIDWRALPGDLLTAIGEALKGIQWAKLFGAGTEFAGSVLGAALGLLTGVFEGIVNGTDKLITGLFTSVGTFFSNAFKAAGDDPNLLSVGANIILGIGNGIINWFKNVGTWVKTNILDPFVKGFKNAFGIHSPASESTLLDAAGNVALGILAGIAKPFVTVGTWVKEHILSPIASALKKPSEAVNVAVGLAKSGWKTVTDWIGNIPGVSQLVSLAKSGWKTVADWIGKIPGVSQLVSLAKSGWKTVADWIGKIPGVSQLVSLAKSGWKTVADWIGKIPGVSQLVSLAKSGWKTVADWIGKIPGVSQLVSLAKSGWKTVKDWIGKIPGVSQLVSLAKSGWKTVADWIGKIPGVSQLVSLAKSGWKTVKDWIGKIPGVSQLVSLAKSGWKTVGDWVGNSLGKAVSFTIGLAKGWSGTVAKALGLDNLSSAFNIKLPKVSVTWEGSPIALPKFSVKWNAKGGILEGAQLFGLAGNTLLGGGEAGREAVLPLDRNTGWMDRIADKVAQRVASPSSSGSQNITVYVTLDGQIVGKSVVKYVQNQARSGNFPLAGLG